jgi:hypothetical protein
LPDRREMMQTAKRRLRLDSEARDLVGRQVIGNLGERSGIEEASIDDEFTRAR